MYGLRDSSIAKIRELFDFTRCERADGTAYGTAGKCRLGVEAEKTKDEKAIDRAMSTFAKGLDRKKIEKYYNEVAEEKDSLLQAMDEKKVSPTEIDRFARNHPGKGDFMTAKVITVGMEETLPKDPSPDEIDQGVAVRLAQERVRKRLGLDHMPKELVVAGEIQTPGEPLYRLAKGETKNIPGAPFWAEQEKLLKAAGARSVENGRSYSIYASKDHAGLELGAVPAASTKAWPVGTRPWVHSVGQVHAAIGDRKTTERLYHDDRVKALMGQLDKAISNNPNLTTIALAPGKNKKGAELTKLVFTHLQEKGAQVYERRAIATADGKTKAVIRVATVQGKGGHPITVIDPGVSVSAPGVTNKFRTEVADFLKEAKAGQVQPTGYNSHPTARDERKAAKPVKPAKPAEPAKPAKPEQKTVKLADPVEAGRKMLAAFRASGMKDADIRRQYPKLHQNWDRIQ